MIPAPGCKQVNRNLISPVGLCRYLGSDCSSCLCCFIFRFQRMLVVNTVSLSFLLFLKMARSLQRGSTLDSTHVSAAIERTRLSFLALNLRSANYSS